MSTKSGKSKKVLLWDVKLGQHRDERFQWARMLPSFEKGWIMITKNTLKAKVTKGATDAEICLAVKSRLARDGQPTSTPIKVDRR